MLKAVLIFFFCLVASALAVTNPSTAELYANDNHVLQLNLAYERLEIAFTTQFLNTFSVTDFVAEGYDPYVYNYIQLILETEEAHAALIESTIISRGAALPANCTAYQFPGPYPGSLSSVTDYLGLELFLQSNIVYALDGSINVINDKNLIQTAATIATVEARMTASLELILGMSPFYNKTGYLDMVQNASTLVGKISGFFSSCATTLSNLTLPVPLLVLPQNNGTTGSLTNPGLIELEENDIAVLQYALTLEHLEAHFYSTGQQNFTMQDFLDAGIAPGVRRYLNIIRAHEKAHVALLELVIRLNGYTPVPHCQYNYNTNNVTQYLALARVLENTGVSAYDGAANRIFNPAYKQVAAQIATIEARHAAFLNEVNAALPFPDYFDPALTPAEVVAIVTESLIYDCPYPFNGTLTLPVVIVVPNDNTTSTSTGSVSTGSRTSGSSSTGSRTSGSSSTGSRTSGSSSSSTGSRSTGSSSSSSSTGSRSTGSSSSTSGSSSSSTGSRSTGSSSSSSTSGSSSTGSRSTSSTTRRVAKKVLKKL